MTKQIVCFSWGTVYGKYYINRLYAMVARNITGPFRFICLTDNPEGIRPEVECFDCPTVPAKPPHDVDGWRKLVLWAPQVADLEGEVLYLDVDVLIVDNIDCFWEHPGDFCIIKNWTTAPELKIGNSSVFRYRIGENTDLWERFTADPEGVIASADNEQVWVTQQHGNVTWWPDEWCRSFKVHCIPKFPMNWLVPPKLPAGTKFVIFHGTPNPEDAEAGVWPTNKSKLKKIYKHIRVAPWVKEHWHDRV